MKNAEDPPTFETFLNKYEKLLEDYINLKRELNEHIEFKENANKQHEEYLNLKKELNDLNNKYEALYKELKKETDIQNEEHLTLKDKYKILHEEFITLKEDINTKDKVLINKPEILENNVSKHEKYSFEYMKDHINTLMDIKDGELIKSGIRGFNYDNIIKQAKIIKSYMLNSNGKLNTPFILDISQKNIWLYTHFEIIYLLKHFVNHHNYDIEVVLINVSNNVLINYFKMTEPEFIIVKNEMVCTNALMKWQIDKIHIFKN